MENSFSLVRLGKLIKKQFFENARFYFYCFLALVGLLALVFTFWIGTDDPSYNEQATLFIFVLGLYVTGSIFSSMSFNMLGQRDKGIFWLTLPATHLEKLLCTLFYTVIVFSVAYFVCYMAVKTVAIAYLKTLIDKHPGWTFRPIESYNVGFARDLPKFIYAFFGVSALYTFGSVYFSRYSFVVTSVVAALVFFAFGFYMGKIDNMLPNNGGWNFTSFEIPNNDIRTYKVYSVSPGVATILENLLKFAWAPILWVATWFRLNEKQI